jgi:hypothetical protein
MCHIQYWIKLDRELDHMPMVLLVQHKQSPAEQLTKRLQQLSIQHTAASQTTALAAPPTKMSEVHTMQSTNPKATQQPKGKKKQ